jgi:hypothetical protein
MEELVAKRYSDYGHVPDFDSDGYYGWNEMTKRNWQVINIISTGY